MRITRCAHCRIVWFPFPRVIRGPPDRPAARLHRPFNTHITSGHQWSLGGRSPQCSSKQAVSSPPYSEYQDADEPESPIVGSKARHNDTGDAEVQEIPRGAVRNVVGIGVAQAPRI